MIPGPVHRLTQANDKHRSDYGRFKNARAIFIPHGNMKGGPMQPISRQELEAMNEQSKEDFVLINVLPRKAFNESHIRTSINIPHENPDFTALTEQVAGGKSRKIIVYCASFDCHASDQAARKLDEAGFQQVFDYEGGTKDWMENH